MGFSMSASAKKYYNKLKDSNIMKIQFDFYYICLLAGFAHERIKTVEGDEFLKSFPTDYTERRDQIIGTLLVTEIRRCGVDVNNKARVQELMLKLVKPDSQTRLSDEGEKLLNKYAEGGFSLIKEKFDDSHSMGTFLVRYHDEIMARH